MFLPKPKCVSSRILFLPCQIVQGPLQYSLRPIHFHRVYQPILETKSINITPCRFGKIREYMGGMQTYVNGCAWIRGMNTWVWGAILLCEGLDFSTHEDWMFIQLRWRDDEIRAWLGRRLKPWISKFNLGDYKIKIMLIGADNC